MAGNALFIGWKRRAASDRRQKQTKPRLDSSASHRISLTSRAKVPGQRVPTEHRRHAPREHSERLLPPAPSYGVLQGTSHAKPEHQLQELFASERGDSLPINARSRSRTRVLGRAACGQDPRYADQGLKPIVTDQEHQPGQQHQAKQPPQRPRASAPRAHWVARSSGAHAPVLRPSPPLSVDPRRHAGGPAKRPHP